MDIEELVSKIQDAVLDIRYLNNGGCGVFAAMVAKRLNKIGIPAVVRIGDWTARRNKNRLVEAINNNSPDGINMAYLREQGIGFDHLIVEFEHGGKTYHLDSNYFHKKKATTSSFGCSLYNGYLTPKQALIIAKSRNWNSLFNRKQIPLMIRKLNQVFN